MRTAPAPAASFTWAQALRTPAFWVFALASSVYNLVASGVGLFNESILAERGFPADIYHRSLVVCALTSLVGNFLGGWLASRWSVNRLMALTMALLAGALAASAVPAAWGVEGLRAKVEFSGDALRDERGGTKPSPEVLARLRAIALGAVLGHKLRLEHP